MPSGEDLNFLQAACICEAVGLTDDLALRFLIR
jgi:hypothetical protein